MRNFLKRCKKIEQRRRNYITACCNYCHSPNNRNAKEVAADATRFNDRKFFWQSPLRSAIWLKHYEK